MFINNTLNVTGRTLSQESTQIDAARFNHPAAVSPAKGYQNSVAGA
jgi:hypothetical protein